MRDRDAWVKAGFWAVIAYTVWMLAYVGPTIDAAAGVTGYMLRLQLAFDLAAIPTPPPPAYFRMIGFDLGYAALYGPALAAVFHRYGRGLTQRVWLAPLVDMLLNWTETGLEITALSDPSSPLAPALFTLHSFVAVVKWVLLGSYLVVLAILGAQLWRDASRPLPASDPASAPR